MPKRRCGLEGGALAEDLLVRLEADVRAAPVLDRAEALQLARPVRRARSSGGRAFCPRATSTSSDSESALTTDTPTPCSPPEVL